MGIFNNKGLAQSLAARVQGRAAAGTAQPQNGFARMAQNAINSRAEGAQNPSSRMGLGAAIKAAQANSIRNQTQSGALSQSGFGRMAQNATANRAAAQINTIQPTPVSPTAFTNQDAIGGMFGTANNGAFTRTVGTSPLAQMVDPGYDSISMDQSQITTDPLTGRTIDPTADQSAYAPVPPPTGVQTNITPNYELNTQ